MYIDSDFFNGSPTVRLQTNKNRARVSIGSGAFGVMLLSKELTLPPNFARSGTCKYVYYTLYIIVFEIHFNTTSPDYLTILFNAKSHICSSSQLFCTSAHPHNCSALGLIFPPLMPSPMCFLTTNGSNSGM